MIGVIGVIEPKLKVPSAPFTLVACVARVARVACGVRRIRTGEPEAMTIAATCTCGKRFGVPDEYAGKRVKCSACGQPVSIPNAGSAADPAPTVSCGCGAQFRLTPQVAGKKVRCPKCKETMQLPELPGSQAPIAAQPVPAQPVPAQPVPAQTVPAQPVTAQPVTAQPVTAQPVTAQPVAVQPTGPNPFADGDGIWDEIRTTSAPSDPGAPQPSNHTGELSANEIYAYAIQLFHRGYGATEVQQRLEDQGLTPSDAERLVDTLVTESKSSGGDSLGFLLIELHGGITRTQFWLATVIRLVISVVIGGIIGAGLAIAYGEVDLNSVVFRSIVGGYAIIDIYMAFAIAKKRFDDLDMSGWWFLGLLVPIVNIFVIVKLGFIKGYL